MVVDITTGMRVGEQADLIIADLKKRMDKALLTGESSFEVMRFDPKYSYRPTGWFYGLLWTVFGYIHPEQLIAVPREVHYRCWAKNWSPEIKRVKLEARNASTREKPTRAIFVTFRRR